MADRTFTEGEAYALVDDGVKRETAARDTRISELEGEINTLKTTNDVLVTEKAAETQRADQAAQALIDYKDGVEAEKAREQLRTERVAAVSAASPVLEMTDERANRIVAMTDDAFTSFVTDLREIAAKSKPFPPEKDGDKGKDDGDGDDGDAGKTKTKPKDIPRESAAFGGTTDTKPTGTVKGLIGASRSLRAS